MARTVAIHLMFEGAADQAMTLYVSLFKDSAITRVERYGPEQPGAEGWVKRADLTIAGQRVICIDSPVKHNFTFTASMSIFVNCESETELLDAFGKLSAGGSVFMPVDYYGFSTKFGWVSDRFGVSWQLNLE